MTENKRFINNPNESDSLIDCSFTDNLTKKIYAIDEWDRIIGLCNNLWKQTQRFEKHNQRLKKENEQLKSEKDDWKANCLSNVNENSILWNEIAIMREQGAKPSDAFRQYLHGTIKDLPNDYQKLTEENKELRQTIGELGTKLDFAICETDDFRKKWLKCKEQNQGLQFKIIDMLDFIKEKGTVTRQEIKEWWNNKQRDDMNDNETM